MTENTLIDTVKLKIWLTSYVAVLKFEVCAEWLLKIKILSWGNKIKTQQEHLPNPELEKN